MVHVQGPDTDAGGRFDPLFVRIGFHSVDPRQALFLFTQVDIGDKRFQDLFGHRADVQGNIFRDALEQAVVVAVVVGEQHRLCGASVEHLGGQLLIRQGRGLVRVRKVGPEVDEDALPIRADFGAASADLVGAAIDGQSGHGVISFLSYIFEMIDWSI